MGSKAEHWKGLKDTYYSMRARCEHKNHVAYSRYGGRGISVCDKWKDDPMAFIGWAMNNGYKKGLTLDRIDNDKGYCPENCRWATPKEQVLNRRKTVLYDGLSLEELADKHGINPKTLRDRLCAGRSVEDAVKKRIVPKEKRCYNKPLREIAKENGIKHATLRRRLARGKSLEEALSMKLQEHKTTT